MARRRVKPTDQPFEESSDAIQVQEKDAPVRIRSGPGTNYSHDGGQYLGKGSHSVDKVSDGMGSKSGWGHLADGRGWIALDFVEILK